MKVCIPGLLKPRTPSLINENSPATVYIYIFKLISLSLKSTLWPLHVIHLSSEPPVLHLQLHDASTQQVGLLLHQLQVDSDLRLPGVGGVSNLEQESNEKG